MSEEEYSDMSEERMEQDLGIYTLVFLMTVQDVNMQKSASTGSTNHISLSGRPMVKMPFQRKMFTEGTISSNMAVL